MHLENTLKEQYQRFVAVETLITLLTTENNKLNICFASIGLTKDRERSETVACARTYTYQ